MVRLLLIAILLVAFAACVVILASIVTKVTTAGAGRMASANAELKDASMTSPGIQKAAYVALIIVLFGVASGWLGGL